MRIVSLVPSLTEFLFDIGLDDDVVGVTRYCIHPQKALAKCANIGGTKDPKVEQIRRLNPDLVIANKEENIETHIRECETFCEVLTTDISSISQSFDELLRIGERVNRRKESQTLINNGISLLSKSPSFSPLKVAYFIWRKPWMVVGGDTFINDALSYAGLENIFKDQNRYPEISLSDLKNMDLILLSSEPYAFNEKHARDFREAGIEVPIHVVDGEWFSWYGSRYIRSIPKIIEWRKYL